jgi:hypothetical protein
MSTTELTVVERAAVALGTTEREKELRELVARSTDIVEIKNTAGRDQCHGAAMALRTARTSIRKVGKDARDDATKFSKAVIAEEDRLVGMIEPEETRLIALRDAWDEAREAEKRAKAEAEARRVAAIRERIADISAQVTAVAGKSADHIESVIRIVVALSIDVENFSELAGEAEMVRGETLTKLRELLAAAVAQEAEAKRLAEEKERLDRERAAFEEEQRQAAAARAEQERKDAEARAAREAEERVQREKEEAERREQQAREDAERRARIAAEEARLAEERAEMQRRQAELDKIEAARREQEAKALREMAEAAERAERDRIERERAENRAARLAPEPTGGDWSIGKTGGCVVTTHPIPGVVGGGHDDTEYYGGHLICESVMRPADAHIIAASRDMYETLQAVSDWLFDSNANHELRVRVDAVLAKALYQPEPQAVAA